MHDTPSKRAAAETLQYALYSLSRISLAGFSVGVALAAVEDWRSGSLLALPVASLGVALTGWASLSRNASHTSRVAAVFCAYWLACVALMALFGTLGPVPFVGLSVAVTLVSVLHPARTAHAFVLVLLSVALIGALMTSGHLTPVDMGILQDDITSPAARFDPRRVGTWVRDLVLFSILTLVSIWVIRLIYSRLQEALEKEQSLNQMIQRQTREKLLAIEEHAVLRQQLDEMERIDSLGRLAAGVAHDFNNLLAVIQTNTTLARDLADPAIYEELDDIHQASAQAAALVSQLMSFSNQPVEETKTVLVDERVLGTLKLVERLLPANIHLQQNLDAKQQRFVGQPSTLDRVLVNLCINARDAMAAGGRIEVSTSVVDRPAKEGESQAVWTRLSVRDDGVGVPHAIIDEIFEPHFSSKPDQGHGLGLTLVKQFVEDANGFIEMDSSPNEGSVFSVYLPTTIDALPIGIVPASSEEFPYPLVKGASVLLVDDDHLVLAATKRMLQRTGCRVLSASSGEEAIELFAKHASEIDLLVTDSVMPGASGLDVYRTIAQHERLPVLFCSGYSHESFEDGFFDETDRDWLQKPVLRSVLLEKMSTLLASHS